MAEIGIVIVTYNSEAEIGASLDAALLTGADCGGGGQRFPGPDHRGGRPPRPSG